MQLWTEQRLPDLWLGGTGVGSRGRWVEGEDLWEMPGGEQLSMPGEQKAFSKEFHKESRSVDSHHTCLSRTCHVHTRLSRT